MKKPVQIFVWLVGIIVLVGGFIYSSDFIDYHLTNSFDFFGLSYPRSLWEKGAEWDAITRWMTTVAPEERQILVDNIRQSLTDVRGYRTTAMLYDYVPEFGNYGVVKLWGTFVSPDRVKLRYHNVTSDEWDEQTHVGDRVVSHYNRIIDKKGNGWRQAESIFVEIEDPEFKDITKRIVRMLSLERLIRLLAFPRTKVLEAWEDRRHYALTLFVERWEEGPGLPSGEKEADYFVELEVLKRGMRLGHIRVVASQKTHNLPDTVLAQRLFDYNGPTQIEMPQEIIPESQGQLEISHTRKL